MQVLLNMIATEMDFRGQEGVLTSTVEIKICIHLTSIKSKSIGY